MKRKRLLTILKLINEYPISTQEELLKYLEEKGFDVTQATVSRDIKELKLVKKTDEQGRYVYCIAQEKNDEQKNDNISLIIASVVDVRCACNMVCVLCTPGTAGAICFMIDEIKSPLIIGTLAGDDTIFVMCPSESEASEVCQMIKKLAKKD